MTHEQFTQIYLPFSGKMYALAYNLLRNRDEARDCVQDVYAELGKLVIMFSCQGLLDNSDLRNGETDGQAVRLGEFCGTNTAMQGKCVFDDC